MVRPRQSRKESPQDRVLDPEPSTGHYFVILLDVLGQRRWLAPYCGPVNSPDSLMEAFSAVEQAVQPVVWLRRAAVQLTTEERGVLQHIRTQFPGHVPYSPGAQSSGDTVVVFHRLYSKEPWGQKAPRMPGIMLGFAVCARIMLQGLAKGFPLRGAIELGVATDVFRHEVYGPAVMEAGRIEQEEADYMRVVVGRGLSEMLNEGISPSVPGSVPPEEQHLAKRAMSMLTTDPDGKLVLDYLGQTIRASIDERAFTKAATEAHGFLMSTKLASRDADPHISDKYSTALKYFATRGRRALSGNWTPHLPRDDKPWLATT